MSFKRHVSKNNNVVKAVHQKAMMQTLINRVSHLESGISNIRSRIANYETEAIPKDVVLTIIADNIKL